VKKAIMLFTLILLSGCAPLGILTDSMIDFRDAGILVKENKFQEALSAYNKIVTETAPSALAADVLYEIGLIHAHPDNPKQDYAKAVQAFEKFMKGYPDHDKASEVRIWISSLKTVQELNKQIDQLKRIDIRHEERRREK
jgi:outer membrane protein assembly factor BamD (BamD/ComL family)